MVGADTPKGVTGAVLSKAKSLTTRGDLTIGIGNAISALDSSLYSKISLLAVSSTLATNVRACIVLRNSVEKVKRGVLPGLLAPVQAAGGAAHHHAKLGHSFGTGARRGEPHVHRRGHEPLLNAVVEVSF